MRILLIAYEWPPITAAQSLRWFYLANGLAELGVEVHVLCPSIRPEMPFRGVLHHGIVEHRVWPGPFVGVLQAVIHRRAVAKTSSELHECGAVEKQPQLVGDLARRGYVYVRRFLDQLVFPDVRTEWYPFARKALLRLLKQYHFDVVVSSHEPGVDLMLGLLAQQKSRLPWVVDLADPLLAPYTPNWRRRLDSWFEGVVLRKSTSVVLTTPHLVEVLVKRHKAVIADKFAIVPQGGPILNSKSTLKKNNADELHFVFTGNFYQSFRNPSELARALKKINSHRIRLTIAGSNAAFVSLFEDVDGVNFLGVIDHFEALKLQQQADILLNIGNGQSDQLPGKVFEYLVSDKPIFHIRGSSQDPTEPYLQDHSCAFIADNNEFSIFMTLERILATHARGALQTSAESSQMLVEKHGWPARALVLNQVLADAVSRSRFA